MKPLTKKMQQLISAVAMSLAATLITMPAVAIANDDGIRIDQEYHANVDKARNMLQARGYQVSKISADDRQGQKSLQVAARKNGYEWDIRLSYPTLKILQERRGE